MIMTYGRGKTRSAQSSGYWLPVAQEWFVRLNVYPGLEHRMWYTLLLAAEKGEI